MAKDNRNITWWEVNNLVPLIITFVTMALAFASLKTDIAVIQVNQDKMLVYEEKMEQRWSQIEVRLGTNEVNIAQLRAIQGIR